MTAAIVLRQVVCVETMPPKHDRVYLLRIPGRGNGCFSTSDESVTRREMMAILVHHFLEESAILSPDKEALIHAENRFSYVQLDTRSNQIANWFLSRGVRRGDRIAILHRNSVNYICSYFATLKVGAIAVPFSTGIHASEIHELLPDCDPLIFVSESFFLKGQLIDEILRYQGSIDIVASGEERHASKTLGRPWTFLEDICNSSSSVKPDIPIRENDLAAIIYTSGSTSKPKGVMLSHLNIVENTKSIVTYLSLDKSEKCMVILPFYYAYGKSLLHTHFAVGATVIIDNRFSFPNVVLKEMVLKEATSFAGVPSTYSILLNRSSIAKMRFPKLRYFTQAGGHMPATQRIRLAEMFPEIKLIIMYGATEASARLAYLDPDDLKRKPNSIGKPIPNVEMRVVSENGEEIPRGQEGEISARGPNIMQGYWRSPVATEEVIRDGWYMTGDLGFCDEDGFFFVTGRKRDMIKVGVHKVSAIEVEEVLYALPGVREAAVIGTVHESLGEAVRAVVVGDAGAVLDEIQIFEHCSKHLPDYKVPLEIKIVEELPKNDAGKIMKRELRQMFRDLSVNDGL